jgi:hypothetical protein
VTILSIEYILILALTGDLKGVFDRLQLFWMNQHRDLDQILASERNRRSHPSRLEAFVLVRHLIHDRAIALIYKEIVKLSPPVTTCSGFTQKATGLPCQHILFERQQRGESQGYMVYPEDIHRHWWLDRTQASNNTPILIPILEPFQAVTGGRKAHPKAGSRKAGYSESSTRRLPSLHEYPVTQFATNPPTSTAPARLEAMPIRIPTLADQHQAFSNISLSSTALGKRRLEWQGDTYEPGTQGERHYKRQAQRANQEASDDQYRHMHGIAVSGDSDSGDSDQGDSDIHTIRIQEEVTASQVDAASISQLFEGIEDWDADDVVLQQISYHVTE